MRWRCRWRGWPQGASPGRPFELEFFLLANERDAEGPVQPARACRTGAHRQDEVYSFDHCTHGNRCFRHLCGGKAKGWADTVIPEYAPGQYELTRLPQGRAARRDDLVK